MKKPLLLGLALAIALVGLALWLPSLRSRLADAPVGPGAGEDRGAAPTPPPISPSSPSGASPRPEALATGAVPSTTLPGRAASPRPPLKPLGRSRLDAQVAKVVASMDLTGRPPTGVTQGGRKGKEAGVFQNLERRLPVKPAGYYRESDVWPRAATGRGPERLVFGREGEVYYSKDHYRNFVRLR